MFTVAKENEAAQRMTATARMERFMGTSKR
jgi:hypothetical protein